MVFDEWGYWGIDEALLKIIPKIKNKEVLTSLMSISLKGANVLDSKNKISYLRKLLEPFSKERYRKLEEIINSPPIQNALTELIQKNEYDNDTLYKLAWFKNYLPIEAGIKQFIQEKLTEDTPAVGVRNIPLVCLTQLATENQIKLIKQYILHNLSSLPWEWFYPLLGKGGKLDYREDDIIAIYQKDRKRSSE